MKAIIILQAGDSKRLGNTWASLDGEWTIRQRKNRKWTVNDGQIETDRLKTAVLGIMEAMDGDALIIVQGRTRLKWMFTGADIGVSTASTRAMAARKADEKKAKAVAKMSDERRRKHDEYEAAEAARNPELAEGLAELRAMRAKYGEQT